MIHFQFSKICQSFSPPQKKNSASKTLFDESVYEIAGDDVDELFYSKNSLPVIIIGLGNIVFVG
jgi:hypothetical protein